MLVLEIAYATMTTCCAKVAQSTNLNQGKYWVQLHCWNYNFKISSHESEFISNIAFFQQQIRIVFLKRFGQQSETFRQKLRKKIQVFRSLTINLFPLTISFLKKHFFLNLRIFFNSIVFYGYSVTKNKTYFTFQYLKLSLNSKKNILDAVFCYC